MSVALDLQPTFAPCPTCGMLVCVRLWVMAKHTEPGHWQELATPQSPVTGLPHTCKG